MPIKGIPETQEYLTCNHLIIFMGFLEIRGIDEESYGFNHNSSRIPLDNFKYSDKISVCGDMKNGQSLVVIDLKDGLDCANQIISKYE